MIIHLIRPQLPSECVRLACGKTTLTNARNASHDEARVTCLRCKATSWYRATERALARNSPKESV